MKAIDRAARATAKYTPRWCERSRRLSVRAPVAFPSLSLRPGSILGARYMVHERLGWGGSATVYRADDLALARTVALKVLHTSLAKDRVVRERFRREAASAGRLVNEHIVRIYDRGVCGEQHYIAMEYVAGRSLRTIIKSDGPLPPSRAVALTIQILHAAGFAHYHGIIHRDLKPQNIIVDPRDNVKVTDFGIAFAGQSDLTPAGSVLGTVDYLSPEQITGRTATKASDLYSVGIILYELLTGRPPFEGDLPITVALKHLDAMPPSPASFNDAISPALNSTVLRALDKSPTTRFPDARAFISALQHATPTTVLTPRFRSVQVAGSSPAPAS
jgi:eukaryotic-like serine/threonine-protein kinase